MHIKRSRIIGSLAAVTLLAVAAPTFSYVHAQSHAQSHAQAVAMVKSKGAKVLANPKGLTLYVFATDKQNKSTCYATCAKYWPPALVTSKPAKTMAGIPGTFGWTKRTDGTHQLTYDGAPLYTFVQDKDAGDTYGQGMFASGGFWWAVVAAGQKAS